MDKKDWITSRQLVQQQQSLAPAYEYVDGEQHCYLGDKYALQIIHAAKKSSVALVNNTLIMHLRSPLETSKREQLLNEWYRQQLKTIVPPLIEQYEALMNVSVKELGVKRMKTRWGTCNPQAQRIWVNLELAKKPLECLEYIVVHELAHLIEPSHNHRFKAIMDTYLPDWRERKVCLNQIT